MTSSELNTNSPQEETIEVIIIDLEEYFEEQKPHPEHHHHRVFHYRVKVNHDAFVLRDKHVKGIELLSLVGKSPEKDQLFQIIRIDGKVREVGISPEETVDLSRHHTKKFETQEKSYCFFIGRKEYRTHHKQLTVRQILVDFAEVSPEDKTLAQKTHGGIHEFKDLNEEIPLKDCPHFTLFDNKPTELS
jgi:Multiubiquitin